MNDLTLYILMRNDLLSMSVGRCMAQASHASNAFVKKYDCDLVVKKWQKQTEQGFGTAIVLSADMKQITETALSCKLNKYKYDYVVDPEYSYIVNREIFGLIDKDVHTTDPIEKPNGEMILHRREITCLYAFGDRNDIKFYSIFSTLNLY